MYIRSGVLVITSRYRQLLSKSKIFKSLKFRILLIVFLVGIIPSDIARQYLLSNYEDRAVSVRTSDAMNQCRILANHLAGNGYLLNPTVDTSNSELALLSNLYDGRIMIIDNNFRIVKDTYGISETKTVISEEVIRCFKGEMQSSYDKVNHYIEITIPIVSPESGEIVGVMLTSISTDGVVESIEVLHRKAIILEITMALFIFAIALGVSTFLVQPFARVTKAISGVKEGFAEEQISIPDYLETESITNAFNQMLARMKVLDDSRQEFVSNVSHELKTPLASMKVLSDSLLLQEKDAVPVELYREFMEDIAAEIDRENTIITDLLSLVKMDKTEAAPNIELEDINQMIELILKRLRPIAAKSNIELVFESLRPVMAEVDHVKLTLAFSNLVENAIKYNKENGWVKVTLNADHQFFTVIVADSGIGMPEAVLEHIFERFYRVDKSHSREIGGTGLGLAIARSAILIHRGAIKVASAEGEGTVFTVKIPLTYIAQK